MDRLSREPVLDDTQAKDDESCLNVKPCPVTWRLRRPPGSADLLVPSCEAIYDILASSLDSGGNQRERPRRGHSSGGCFVVGNIASPRDSLVVNATEHNDWGPNCPLSSAASIASD
jgi:hypothetical protein